MWSHRWGRADRIRVVVNPASAGYHHLGSVIKSRVSVFSFSFCLLLSKTYGRKTGSR